MPSFKDATKAYEDFVVEFTELNAKYNRALREDSLTDELELEFLRAEKKRDQLYAEVSDAQFAELGGDE